MSDTGPRELGKAWKEKEACIPYDNLKPPGQLTENKILQSGVLERTVLNRGGIRRRMKCYKSQELYTPGARGKNTTSLVGTSSH